MLAECYGVRERQGERAERVVRPRRWRGGATNTTDDPPTLLPSRSGPSVIAIKSRSKRPVRRQRAAGSRTLRIPSPMLDCLSPCMAARTHYPGPPKHLGASDSERMMMLLPCLCPGVVIGKAHAMLPSRAIPAGVARHGLGEEARGREIGGLGATE